MDKTLILVKPDAFARNLTGEIIARFERKGLRIAALKHMTMDTQLAEQHYAEHDGKPFFGELVSFITSGPLVAMVLEGDEAVPRRAPGDRRDQPARGDHRLDPRRLRRRGRPEHGPRLRLRRVRRARGEPVLPRPLILASASPQRRAILEQAGHPVRGAGLRRRGGDRGRPALGRGGERAPQGAGRRSGAGDARPRRRHRRRPRRRRSSASRADEAQARGVPGAPLRAHPRGRRRIALVRGGELLATAVEVTEVTSHPRPVDARVVREVEGVGGPRRRLRDPGPRRGADHRNPGRLSERRRTAAGTAAEAASGPASGHPDFQGFRAGRSVDCRHRA